MSLKKSIKDSETSNPTVSSKGVDDAVGVTPAKWFVAIVNSRHEKAVRDNLLKINIEGYVATQQEMRVWNNGKRRLVDRVVIPSMVFVKCTEKVRRDIVALPFINRFLVNRSAASGEFNRPVAVISDAAMEKLKFMLGHSDSPVGFISTEYKVNDNVRVVRGNLRGLEGEIRENSDGTHTLVVSIPLLGGATVFIDPCDVEKIVRRESK